MWVAFFVSLRKKSILFLQKRKRSLPLHHNHSPPSTMKHLKYLLIFILSLTVSVSFAQNRNKVKPAHRASLSAINAENQQIIKQTPNFTPKNIKLGVFILFKTNHIRSENNLIKNRTNEKNNQFIFRKISYLCSK